MSVCPPSTIASEDAASDEDVFEEDKTSKEKLDSALALIQLEEGEIDPALDNDEEGGQLQRSDSTDTLPLDGDQETANFPAERLVDLVTPTKEPGSPNTEKEDGPPILNESSESDMISSQMNESTGTYGYSSYCDLLFTFRLLSRCPDSSARI